jgi:hypothetical protein
MRLPRWPGITRRAQQTIFYGQAMTAGDIYRVAGGGASLGDGAHNRLRAISP